MANQQPYDKILDVQSKHSPSTERINDESNTETQHLQPILNDNSSDASSMDISLDDHKTMIDQISIAKNNKNSINNPTNTCSIDDTSESVHVQNAISSPKPIKTHHLNKPSIITNDKLLKHAIEDNPPNENDDTNNRQRSLSSSSSSSSSTSNIPYEILNNDEDDDDDLSKHTTDQVSP